jgi:putative ABC transport system substrate-binding protein
MTCRRIRLLVTLVLGLLVVPLAADSPAGHVPRIGVLGWGAPPSAAAREQHPFLRGLRELGWVEGQNIAIESRWAEFSLDRLPDLAADLIRLKVEVIMTLGGPAARAAKQATTTIPIVINVGNAVEQGLVTNLARPEGNITGVSRMSPELSQKYLELLNEAIPQLSYVAVLWCPEYAGNPPQWSETQVVAHTLGIQLQSLEVWDPDDIDAALEAATSNSAQALIVFDCALFDPSPTLQRIIGLAAKHRLPAIFWQRRCVEVGGLMSYGPSMPDLARRTATYVDKILKGAQPADLPVEQPMKFELIINLKTAQALGLTIPPTLLFQADEVLR